MKTTLFVKAFTKSTKITDYQLKIQPCTAYRTNNKHIRVYFSSLQTMIRNYLSTNIKLIEHEEVCLLNEDHSGNK